mmetsp:Transcript_7529/g.18663  ORF Transcript_7529/g.18663 Transcript_7529/m.18663 type:complete len:303 (-) Transcript_7529:345-1253(-)
MQLQSRVPVAQKLKGAPVHRVGRSIVGRSHLVQCSAQKEIGSDATAPVPSRRELLALAAATVVGVSAAPSYADEVASTSSGNRVYLEVKLEGKPLGKVVIELFDDVTTGSARFRDLVVGKQGVGYRLSRFDGIFPTYLRCEGVKSLSYSATAESPITGGDSVDALEQELASQSRQHDTPGLVSLVVRDEDSVRTKERLIARDGKLVTVVDTIGEAPNGTTFTILRKPDAELNASHLIVGRVVGGQDVVDAIAAQPFAKPRDEYYDSPFFNVAKAMGDKRADVAEKGFYRPLKRILVTKGGLA